MQQQQHQRLVYTQPNSGFDNHQPMPLWCLSLFLVMLSASCTRAYVLPVGLSVAPQGASCELGQGVWCPVLGSALQRCLNASVFGRLAVPANNNGWGYSLKHQPLQTLWRFSCGGCTALLNTFACSYCCWLLSLPINQALHFTHHSWSAARGVACVCGWLAPTPRWSNSIQHFDCPLIPAPQHRL